MHGEPAGLTREAWSFLLPVLTLEGDPGLSSDAPLTGHDRTPHSSLNTLAAGVVQCFRKSASGAFYSEYNMM